MNINKTLPPPNSPHPEYSGGETKNNYDSYVSLNITLPNHGRLNHMLKFGISGERKSFGIYWLTRNKVKIDVNQQLLSAVKQKKVSIETLIKLIQPRVQF